MENKTKTYNHTMKFAIIFFFLFGFFIDNELSIRKVNSLQIQIDSLKKQDSIKELYKVYNVPTGADTLLKPISK